MNTNFWIIDDDPFYTPALKDVIEMEVYGSTVELFSLGSAVIAALKEGRRPSCVVLDMMLPMEELDPLGGLPPDGNREAPGAILARQLIENGVPPACIVVITALLDEKYHRPLISQGIAAQNILIKPARIEQIKKAIRLAASAAATKIL